MDDPLAPKVTRDTLAGILASARQRHQPNGKRRSPVQKPSANRICKICSKLWFKEQILFDPELKPAICDSCDKEIANGMIAIICKDRRYAFASSPHLAAKGPIIEVSPEVMDKVEEEAKQQKPPTTGEQNEH